MRVQTTQTFIEKAKAQSCHENCSYEKTIYVDQNTLVIITCKFHGDFQQRPKIHLKEHGCPQCGHEYRANLNRKTTEFFVERAIKLYNGFYTYPRTVYRGHHFPVIITCPAHGDFEQLAGNHLAGHTCPSCTENARLTNESFAIKGTELYTGKYEYDEVEIVNAHTKVKIKCPDHGPFWQKPNTHLCGCGCPRCKESSGERIIRKWLIKNNIEFKDQYSTNECRNIYPLRFDFAIFQNEKLIGVVEYYGIQHYQLVTFGARQEHAIKNFEDCKMRDKIKVDYCNKNNIPLLIIPYTDKKNIDALLSTFVFTYSLHKCYNYYNK